MRELDIKNLEQNISSRAASDIEAGNIGAASVLVRQSGNIVFKAHFGSDASEYNIIPTDKTLFRIASMTKPITAVVILALAEKGLLNIDDNVEKFIPGFGNCLKVIGFDNGTPVTEPVHLKPTLRHLLSHTSGIGSGESREYYEKGMSAECKASLAASISYYSKNALSFEPFTNQEYSAVAAFDILAGIAEMVSDKDFNTLVAEIVCDPCNMCDTVFLPSADQYNRIIPMHDKKNGKSVTEMIPEGYIFEDYPVSHYLGGAGLISSLSDYSRFAEMLLNCGYASGKSVIKPESVYELSKPQVPEKIQPGFERWGLGVRVITDKRYGRLPVGAYGWSGAYGTHFWIDPENRITAVYMKNSRYDGGSGAKTAANFEEDVFSAML